MTSNKEKSIAVKTTLNVDGSTGLDCKMRVVKLMRVYWISQFSGSWNLDGTKR